ncbi:MAG: (2Fe-2S)-binding protein [Pseudomonadota bacterium]
MAENIAFRVNGKEVAVDAAPSTPLLLTLRNDLALKGTRHGCGEGDCGACTVLLDGRPVTSCNTPVEAVRGQNVETVEQLTSEATPHPLVTSVLEEQAGQCGYCLPGILMRAKALLAETVRPDRTTIAGALDNNLCRCGAHNRIMRAIEKAGAALAGEAQS